MLKALLKKSKKNQKGFTLIELLAVIVILAILAAIAIPSVISIINHQNEKAEVQDALTAIHAAKLYVADHGTGGAQDITSVQLKPYVDKVGGLNGNESVSSGVTYTVHVDATGDYSVSGLPLPSGVSSDTESALITYNK